MKIAVAEIDSVGNDISYDGLAKLGDVTFYDGSMGVAKRLQKIIKDRGYIDCGKVVVEFVDSTGSVEKSNRFYKILGSDIYE